MRLTFRWLGIGIGIDLTISTVRASVGSNGRSARRKVIVGVMGLGRVQVEIGICNGRQVSNTVVEIFGRSRGIGIQQLPRAARRRRKAVANGFGVV